MVRRPLIAKPGRIFLLDYIVTMHPGEEIHPKNVARDAYYSEFVFLFVGRNILYVLYNDVSCMLMP